MTIGAQILGFLDWFAHGVERRGEGEDKPGANGSSNVRARRETRILRLRSDGGGETAPKYPPQTIRDEDPNVRERFDGVNGP